MTIWGARNKPLSTINKVSASPNISPALWSLFLLLTFLSLLLPDFTGALLKQTLKQLEKEAINLGSIPRQNGMTNICK